MSTKSVANYIIGLIISKFKWLISFLMQAVNLCFFLSLVLLCGNWGTFFVDMLGRLQQLVSETVVVLLLCCLILHISSKYDQSCFCCSWNDFSGSSLFSYTVTHYISWLHYFSVTIRRCYRGVEATSFISFFSRTTEFFAYRILSFDVWSNLL